MAGVFHISEEEAARDFGALIRRVRAGVDVVVEEDGRPVVVIRAADTEELERTESGAPVPGRTAEEIIRSFDKWEAEHGKLVMDADFAEDLEAVHALYNQPLDGSQWD
jgi:antitoxin (DNA-binding transcriptional repressor) of toxin-antitoxin stability system